MTIQKITLQPALDIKPEAYIHHKQASYLCRLSLDRGWTERALVRCLRHEGVYRTADLYPWQYRQAVTDAENTVLRNAYLQEQTVVRNGKRERQWHMDLSRDEFYTAYAMSQMTDLQVNCYIGYDQSDITGSNQTHMACLEIMHRLESYRQIARVLEAANE